MSLGCLPLQVLFRRLRDYTKESGLPVLSGELAAHFEKGESHRSSALLYPVNDAFEQDGTPVVRGHLLAWIPWASYFGGVSVYHHKP